MLVMRWAFAGHGHRCKVTSGSSTVGRFEVIDRCAKTLSRLQSGSTPNPFRLRAGLGWLGLKLDFSAGYA